LIHELSQNTLVDIGKALETGAQLDGECSPDRDRLVRSAPDHIGQNRVSVVVCRRSQKD
jgi:hypothetical protein